MTTVSNMSTELMKNVKMILSWICMAMPIEQESTPAVTLAVTKHSRVSMWLLPNGYLTVQLYHGVSVFNCEVCENCMTIEHHETLKTLSTL